jgi:hypothetical protein
MASLRQSRSTSGSNANLASEYRATPFPDLIAEFPAKDRIVPQGAIQVGALHAFPVEFGIIYRHI